LLTYYTIGNWLHGTYENCQVTAALDIKVITNKTPKFPKVEWPCRSVRRRRQSTGVEDDHEPCCHVN